MSESQAQQKNTRYNLRFQGSTIAQEFTRVDEAEIEREFVEEGNFEGLMVEER